MGVSARPVWVPLWTTVVSILAVAALIMSAVALGLVVRGDERAALPAPREAIASGPVISGTGPGLIGVAQKGVRARAWFTSLGVGAVLVATPAATALGGGDADGDRAWMRNLVRGAERSGYAVAGLSPASSRFIPLTPYAAHPLRP